MNVEHDELVRANALLRSAYSIAEREGGQTNWAGFRKTLLAALLDQSILLNGTSNEVAATCTPRTFKDYNGMPK